MSRNICIFRDILLSLHRFLTESPMFGLWCNGSTTGFGSVCPGSNPGSPTTIQLIAAKNPLKSQVLVGFFVILSPSCWHYRYRFFLFTNLWTILLYNWHKFIRFLHFLLLHLHRVRKRCVFDGWSYNLLNVVQSWKRTMKFAMLSIPMMWKATIRKAFAAISL